MATSRSGARPMGGTAQDGANTDETTSGGTPEGAQDAAPAHTAVNAAVADAPEPSGKGARRVQVMPPTNEFVVEGHPAITNAGVNLTVADADKVVAAAKASGVRLMVDGEVVK